jgi:hypothetical protein
VGEHGVAGPRVAAVGGGIGGLCLVLAMIRRYEAQMVPYGFAAVARSRSRR